METATTQTEGTTTTAAVETSPASETATTGASQDSSQLYRQLIAPAKQEEKPAAETVEKPADAELEKQEPVVAQEPVKQHTGPSQTEIAAYERQIAELRGKIDGIAQMQPQPKQEPVPDTSSRFKQSLAKRGIKVDDEKAEQTFKLLDAYNEANFGVDGDTIRAALSKMYDDVESVKAERAREATVSKLNKSFDDAVKGIGGEKQLEALKPQLGEVMKGLKAQGGDTDPNRPLNLSPDIILKLAAYDQMMAEKKATADADAKAKAAKEKNKADASSTPKPAPDKGTQAGVRLDGIKGSKNMYMALIGGGKK